MDDKVSVRWWNHRHALSKAIRSLQHQETFADVILICESKKFEAHKFVLSACSEFFEKELHDIPYRECFYLPSEIKEKHIHSLLDYMYSGESIVKEDEVNPLLKAAEILCIRGLAVPFYYDEEEEEMEEEGSNEVEIKSQKTIAAERSQKAGRSKKKSSDSKLVLQALGDPKRMENSSNPMNYNKIKSEMNMSSTAGEGMYLENANVSCKEENGEGADPQNMDVNDMLTVLMKGEQNPSNFMNSDRNKRKGWSPSIKDGRTHDPKLICPHCLRQFHWRSNLTKHIRTHTGEKPYTCSQCNYKTGYSEALKRHIRTHTGEKPYECSLCDYRCKDGSSLKLHMNKHTGESSFSCHLCTYKTRIRTAFAKHKLTHEIVKEISPSEKIMEPQSELLHQPQSELLHQPQSELLHQPQSELSHQSQSELQHEAQPEIQHQAQSELQHQPQSELQHQPQPELQHQPQPELQHQPQPEIQHQPQPEIQHQPQPELQHQPQPELQHRSQSELQHEPQSGLQHEPQSGLQHMCYEDFNF